MGTVLGSVPVKLDLMATTKKVVAFFICKNLKSQIALLGDRRVSYYLTLDISCAIYKQSF